MHVFRVTEKFLEQLIFLLCSKVWMLQLSDNGDVNINFILQTNSKEKNNIKHETYTRKPTFNKT